jgi:hypothetical protein
VSEKRRNSHTLLLRCLPRTLATSRDSSSKPILWRTIFFTRCTHSVGCVLEDATRACLARARLRESSFSSCRFEHAMPPRPGYTKDGHNKSSVHFVSPSLGNCHSCRCGHLLQTPYVSARKLPYASARNFVSSDPAPRGG